VAESQLPWTPRGLTLPVHFLAPAVSIRATSREDPRIGHLMGREVSADRWPVLAIIGFPCDDGVRRNSAREGASAAPDAIREALYRLTPDEDAPFTQLLARCIDFGNLALATDLQTSQDRLGQVVAACLAHNTIPLMLGGGHETAYGHFLGYVHAERDVAAINWDAHPDVRPLIDGSGHSGSQFRQALLHKSNRLVGYTVAGLQPHSVSAAHLSFIRQNGGRAVWHYELSEEAIDRLYADKPGRAGVMMASFDTDVVDQAYAPGVSAPATGGITTDLWLHAAYRAGSSPHVWSIDLSEMNPRFDRDGQTARLLAVTIWHILKGVTARLAGQEAEEDEKGV
jgi:formiminoglutamase